MSRTPRPRRPSALDGYSRLARAGVSQTAPAADAAADVAHRRRRRRGWRFVGGLRALGLACVLTLIVGASIGLANADPRQSTSASTIDAAKATGAAPRVKETVESVEPDVATEVTSSTAVEPEPDPAAATTVPVAAEREVRAAAVSAELPRTGDPTVTLTVLIGAVLVLLGMAAQIAGQPLPAQRRH